MLEELVERLDFQCGMVKDLVIMNFFKISFKLIYWKVWLKMSEGGLVSSLQEGCERVRVGGYVFIFDYMINLYLELILCEIKMVGILF